jgi:hypothetical protein
MRILVTGRAIPLQPDRCTGQQLADGFRQAGHECVFFGNFYGQGSRFLGNDEVTDQRFDLVVVTEMNDGMPGYRGLFQHWRLRDVPRVYWDFDVSYHPPISYARASEIVYDGYLVGNRYFLGEKEFGRFGKPVLHLPYACSPHIHRRKPDIAKTGIVGFIGSMTPERKAALGDISCVTGVFGEDLIDATNALFFMVHVNQDACRGLVPGRPWETAGCGTNLLMDRASYEDFKQFIPDDLDDAVRCFDDASEIKAFIDTHAVTTAQRQFEESGQRLMDYMHHYHSYRKRAEEIVTWVLQNDIVFRKVTG